MAWWEKRYNYLVGQNDDDEDNKTQVATTTEDQWWSSRYEQAKVNQERRASQKAAEEQKAQQEAQRLEQEKQQDKNIFQKIGDRFKRFRRDVSNVTPEMVAEEVSEAPQRVKDFFAPDEPPQRNEIVISADGKDHTAGDLHLGAVKKSQTIGDEISSTKDQLVEEYLNIVKKNPTALRGDRPYSAAAQFMSRKEFNELEELVKNSSDDELREIIRERLETNDYQFLSLSDQGRAFQTDKSKELKKQYNTQIKTKGFLDEIVNKGTNDGDFREGIKEGWSIPFKSAYDNVVELIDFYNASKKFNSGDPLTEYDQALLEKASVQEMENILDPKGTGYVVSRIFAEAPAFIVEYSTTLPMARGTSAAIQKLPAMQKVASKAPVVSKLIGALGGSTVQTATGFMPRVIESTMTFSTDNRNFVFSEEGDVLMTSLDADQDIEDAFVENLPKGYADVWLEVTSESAGEGVQYVKKGIMAKFFAKHADESVDAASTLARELGWNGMLGEIFEEEIIAYPQAELRDEEYKAPILTPEGNQRLLAETLAFGVMNTVMTAPVTQYQKAQFNKAKNEMYKQADELGIPREEVDQVVSDMQEAAQQQEELEQAVPSEAEQPPAPIGTEQEEDQEPEPQPEGRTPESSLRSLGAEVNDLSKSVQNIRDYMQTQGDTAQTDYVSQSIRDETVEYLSKNPIGANELEFDEDGNITLYRSGNVMENAPNSYSLEQGEGQEPYIINKDEILINTNSQELRDAVSDIYKDVTLSDGTSMADQYVRDLENWNRLESEVIAMPKEVRSATTKYVDQEERVQVKQTPDISEGVGKNLLEEAKKYKSADEFIRSQYRDAPTLYRGTTESGKGAGTASLGRGLYSSPDKNWLENNFKFAEVKKLPTDAYPTKPLIINKRTSSIEDWMLQESGERSMRSFNEKYDLTDFIKSKGYNGVVYGNEVVRFDNAPTKSQLTDIWNQANKSTDELAEGVGKKVIKKAGFTDNPQEALYMTAEGKLVKSLDRGGMQHFEFAEEFMGKGVDQQEFAIRANLAEIIDTGSGGELNVRVFRTPTTEQMNTIKRIAKDRSEVNVEQFSGKKIIDSWDKSRLNIAEGDEFETFTIQKEDFSDATGLTGSNLEYAWDSFNDLLENEERREGVDESEAFELWMKEDFGEYQDIEKEKKAEPKPAKKAVAREVIQQDTEFVEQQITERLGSKKNLDNISEPQMRKVIPLDYVVELTQKMAKKIGTPAKAISISELEQKPSLMWGGHTKGVFSNGFMLMLDEGAAKETNDYIKQKVIKSEQNSILKSNSDLSFDEAMEFAKDKVQTYIENAESMGYPDYEKVTPDIKDMVKADIVGLTNIGNQLGYILRGGDRFSVVNANMMQYMLDKIGSRTVYIGSPKTPVVIMKGGTGGKIGGLIMPIESSGLDVLDKVAEAYAQEQQRKPSKSGGARASVDQYADIPMQTAEPIKEASVPFPEMVQLAKDLMGNYPKISMPRKRKIGRPNGLFIPAGSGGIKLNPTIFADVKQAAKTLAHEIGHLVDYLPDMTLKRGNLLGRIGSLRKFMKGTFSDIETQNKIDKIDAEAEKIRQARRDLERDDSGKVIDKEQDLKLLRELRPLNKKIRKLQEGAIKDSEVRDELWELSKMWRPLQKKELMFNGNTGEMEWVVTEITEEEAEASDPDYVAYRKSAEEIYADSISVLLNDPAVLREQAPKFYTAFFENLDRKPSVKKEYFALMDFLHGGKEARLTRRLEQIYEGYNEAREKRLAIEEEKNKSPYETAREKINAFWSEFMQQHVTRFSPAYAKQKEALKEKGIELSPATELRMQFEEMQMRNNDAFVYLNKMNEDIVNPLYDVGLTEDDLGVMMQLERSATDREGIANPYGLQGEYAVETLAYMKDFLKKKRGISDQQFDILKQATKRFRDYQYEVATAGYQAELYTEDFYNDTIKKSKDTYATFQVIEYLHDNYVTAAVQQATGTLKPIENPFVSSVLKSLSILNQTEIQKGKIAFIDMMEESFPSDIELAQQTSGFGGKGKIAWKKVDNMEHLIVRRNGLLKAYNVDPYMAEMFEFYSPTQVHQLVKVSAQFNKVFKPLVTTWNLSWGFYSNISRDTRRTYKNLASYIPLLESGEKKKVSIFEFISTWVGAIPESARFQRGEVTPLLEEMIDNKAYTSAFANFDTQANENESLSPIMRKFRFLKKISDPKDLSFKRKLFDKSLGRVIKGIEFGGSTLETTTKVAGYQILKKRSVAPKEAAFITRNYVGTPNFIDGGTQKHTDNNIFVFSNVMAQGIRSDLEIATNPTTRAGYWMRTFMIDIMPKLMMLAAAGGLLGDKLKDLMDKATEYDKTNYIIIPLGEESNGKAVYMRIPQDETGRLFSALTWKLGSYINGQGTKPQQIFALGAGYIPSVTPMWEVGGAWVQYATGRNPYDSYRGRNVIDDQTWKAGGLPVFEKMIQYTTNNLGLSQFSTYDDASNTTFDTILEDTPILNRALRATDYGLTEKEKFEDSKAAQEKARDSLRRKKLLEDAIDEVVKYPETFDSVQYDLIRESFGEPPYDSTQRRQITDLKKKLRVGADRGGMSRELESLIDATYLDDKVRRLESYRKTLSNSEYNSLIDDGIKYKAISKELAKRLRKEGLWKH